ncbi:MAG: glycerophosphodiester phosphodiesterase family protein, partial [Guyparkeria sp.]
MHVRGGGSSIRVVDRLDGFRSNADDDDRAATITIRDAPSMPFAREHDSPPLWRRVLGPLLLFETLLSLATLLLLEPLRLLSIERLVALGEDPFVGNIGLLAFAFSPLGALTLLMAGATAVLLLALEFGGLVTILWLGHRGRRVTVAAVTGPLARSLPALVLLSILTILTLAALALPVLAAALALKPRLLSDADIYFYLQTWPWAFRIYVGLVGAVALAAGLAAVGVLLRYGVALPLVVLERRSVSAALRRAGEAVRGRRQHLALRLAVVFALGATATSLVGLGLATLHAELIGEASSTLAMLRVTLAIGLVATLLLTMIGALVRIALASVLVAAYALTAAAGAVAAADVSPGPRGLRMALAALLLVALGSLGHTTWNVLALAGDHPVAITAHRAGSALAPENTLAALERAIAAGADAVEIDVQETRDGHVVLLHDTDLRRVAGVERSLRDLDLEGIGQF